MRNPEAYQFLTELWHYVNASLPPANEVPLQVEREAQDVFPQDPDKPRKSYFLEGAFVSRFITPIIHSFLTSKCGLDHESATHAIISENRIDRIRRFADKNARTAYPFRHPFGKSIGSTARAIVDTWYGTTNALSSKHPDLCIVRPHRILIEAKYLRPKNIDSRVELVKCVYESLFYRGLAPVNDGERKWAYDFAVALVYDGTPDASFITAWKDLRPEVRDAIWNAASIFVMPLRGTDDREIVR